MQKKSENNNYNQNIIFLIVLKILVMMNLRIKKLQEIEESPVLQDNILTVLEILCF
jgi:hypothetical protein